MSLKAILYQLRLRAKSLARFSAFRGAFFLAILILRPCEVQCQPVIVSQPQSRTVNPYAIAFFSVTATGTAPLSYQWQKDGTNVTGANGAVYVFNNAQPANAGTYSVIVSNVAGSVTSAPAVLTVRAARPAGTAVMVGGSVPAGLTNIVAVEAGYNHAAALRNDGTVAAWGGDLQGKDANVPASLSNVVAIAAGMHFTFALKQDGTVSCWGSANVTPPAGLSNVVRVALPTTGGYLFLKSDGTLVQQGGPAAPAGLSNVVSMASWSLSQSAVRSDGTIVSWGTSQVWNGLTNVVDIAIAGDGFGLALRTDGTVTYYSPSGPPGHYLDPIPGISNAVAVSAGQSQYMVLLSDGSVRGNTVPAGLTNVVAMDAGYNSSMVVVASGPTILTQPTNLTVNAGEPASFNVVAAGSPPLTYQWQREGTNIPAATNSTFTLSPAQERDGGSYAVIVNDASGAVTSLPAVLTVRTFPVVLSPAISQGVFIGALVGFTVSGGGSVPLSYQWQRDGVAVDGATSSTLTLATTVSNDAGAYTLVISNSYGSITSAPATLTLTSYTFPSVPPGTVVSLGGPLVQEGLTNAIGIAAGQSHSAALRSDGTVIAWGGDSQGKDANVPVGLSNVVSIVAGNHLTMALKRDGTVVAWGLANIAPPAGMFGVVKIALPTTTGGYLYLKSDGTVVQQGGPTPPAGLSNIVSIAGGSVYQAAVRNDGTIVSWGIGQVWNGLTNVVDVAISGSGFGLALRTDGTVTLHDPGAQPGHYLQTLPGISNAIAVSAGQSQWLVLCNDGTVQGSPVPAGLTDMVAIDAGYNFNLLISTNPPPPMLAGVNSGNSFLLSSPVSVPGYVLEATDDLLLPYTIVNAYTNSTTNTLTLPLSGPKKYYRLRKL